MTSPLRLVVCRAEEIRPGESRIVEANGLEVGIFNLEGRVVAYRNLCPHQGAPVCRGRIGGTTVPSMPGEYVFGLRGQVLHCPWHGWQFDLLTGEGLGNRTRLARISAAVEDGHIVLYLPSK